MFKTRALIFSFVMSVALIGCGGGGGGGSGSGGGVDPNISSPSSGTELVSAIDISNIESIGLVSQSASIALMDKVKDFFMVCSALKLLMQYRTTVHRTSRNLLESIPVETKKSST